MEESNITYTLEFDDFRFFCKTKNKIIMDIKDLKEKNVPIVLIDKSLDFFNDKVLFPAKLEKANEMLRRVGLPKMKTAH